jgi:aminoglycoside phosphotransferase (APT) family kinase protein
MDESRLYTYLRSRLNQDDIQIHNIRNITSGWETEIISFDLRYNSGQVQHLVARIYPGGDRVAKAEKESSTMRIVQELGYPVPRVHILETEPSHLGNPFIIMDRIDGGTLDDRMHEDDEKWMSIFFKLFVDLHKLDWRKMVLPDQIPLFGDPYFYIKTTLSDMERILKHNGKQELLTIIDWAKNCCKEVPFDSPSIIHGDFHTFNVLVDVNEKAYVIDWGAARVADFRVDLAWTLLLSYAYDTRERRDLVLQEYESALGQEVQDIEYFEVLSTVRRLYDVTSSFDGKSGLRPGAVDLMRETAGHIVRVRDRLNELTGITIPKIDKFIDDLN